MELLRQEAFCVFCTPCWLQGAVTKRIGFVTGRKPTPVDGQIVHTWGGDRKPEPRAKLSLEQQEANSEGRGTSMDGCLNVKQVSDELQEPEETIRCWLRTG